MQTSDLITMRTMIDDNPDETAYILTLHDGLQIPMNRESVVLEWFDDDSIFKVKYTVNKRVDNGRPNMRPNINDKITLVTYIAYDSILYIGASNDPETPVCSDGGETVHG